jgi:hypothetical protein
MNDPEVEAPHRESEAKRVSVAGTLTTTRLFWVIFGALWAFSLSAFLTFELIEQTWSAIQVEQANRDLADAAREDAKVSPEFDAEAHRVAQLILTEHAESGRGWNAYKISRDAAQDAIQKLDSMAKSRRETDISLRLSRVESSFSLCVGSGSDPDPFPPEIAQCKSQNPESEIDEALK